MKQNKKKSKLQSLYIYKRYLYSKNEVSRTKTTPIGQADNEILLFIIRNCQFIRNYKETLLYIVMKYTKMDNFKFQNGQLQCLAVSVDKYF